MNRRKKRRANNLGSSSSEVTAITSEWKGPFGIQLLPADIIIDILSRLPIKTILHCKRVCKDWHRLISHPRFVELQLARSSTAILIKTLHSAKKSSTISLIHVEQRGLAPFRLDKLVLTLKGNLPSCGFRFVNSCNGLLCLSWEDDQETIWVCNPILGECVTISSASEGKDWGSFTALGFCSVANRYKLLQTFYPNKWSFEDPADAGIYDMDTGTWRNIGHAPNCYADLPFNSVLCGSLHWVCPSGKRYASQLCEYIYSFNFETEEFGSVPPPPCLDETQRRFVDHFTLRLGVLESCLFLCVSRDGSTKFDIWVMKDYRVKESWTKQFVIKNLYPKSNYIPDFYEPIKFLTNGEILMSYNRWQVVCYNTRTKKFRETSISYIRYGFVSIAHTPSLISLYHVAKGELVKSVQGSRKECANSSAEGTVDCNGFGTSPNEPARSNSTQDQANAEYSGGVTSQALSNTSHQ